MHRSNWQYRLQMSAKNYHRTFFSVSSSRGCHKMSASVPRHLAGFLVSIVFRNGLKNVIRFNQKSGNEKVVQDFYIHI